MQTSIPNSLQQDRPGPSLLADPSSSNRSDAMTSQYIGMSRRPNLDIGHQQNLGGKNKREATEVSFEDPNNIMIVKTDTTNKALHQDQQATMVDDLADEVDSQDSRPVSSPASSSCSGWSSSAIEDVPPLSSEQSLPPSIANNNKKKSKKLTLSAFRRPEQTIRLTDSNPNRRLVAEYDLHAPGCRVLGHGAFSTVRLAVRRCDGVEVAVKTIAKHEALRSRRLRIGGRRDTDEWAVLLRLKNNPYVINLLDVFETDEEIQLVMEYCPGGELFDAIQKKRNQSNSLSRGQYSEADAASICSQILRALVDLHALGVVHRDIKAENVLLTSSDADDEMLHVKLCDFGMARAVYRSNGDGEASPITPPGINRSYSIVGSNYYMAPEVGTGVNYCTSMDIFSLGVTLYILLCGFPPVFTAGNDSDSEVMFSPMFWKDISTEAKDLVKKMLNPDPSSRTSAREALKDPWIVKNIVTSARLSTRSKQQSILGSSSMDNSNNKADAKLELVRNCLYKNLCKETAHNRKRSVSSCNPKQQLGAKLVGAPAVRRRKRPRRASSCLMALADLYREVASPGAAPPATTASTSDLIDHATSTVMKDALITAASLTNDVDIVGGEDSLTTTGPRIPTLSV